MSKIILTGATGFIGAECLKALIKNPSVGTIYVLSRRELPSNDSAKVKVIIQDDFKSYPDSMLDELRGAESCIWTMGIARPKGMDLFREVNVEYPEAAAKAFVEKLSPHVPDGKPFRFTFCSGVLAEKDQTKELSFLQEGRRIKGEAETKIEKVAEGSSGRLQAFIFRPSLVLSPWNQYNPLARATACINQTIRVDQMAASFVDVALNGNDKTTLENKDIASKADLLVK